MIGVQNPGGAVALAAVAVLVALHLRGRRHVVPVATLFLWQRVPAATAPARRFRPDLLFAARLALLLALIGGYLRPYVEDAVPAGDGVRLVLVVDASASMQAREDGGRTRFDLARERARTLVAQLLRDDEVMLVVAADRAHVVVRWTADHARALDRLEGLEPLDTPTDLAPAVELALGEVGARPGTHAVVLTDLPREASGVAVERLAAVDWIAIGHTDDNVAIAGIRVDEAPFRPASAATATVLVRSYAHAPRRVVLEARVDDRPWTRSEVDLPPRGAAPVVLTGPPGSGILTVTLATGDALAVDDRAVAWVAPGEPLDALVVTASPALADALRDVAATLDGSRVRIVEPGDPGPASDARVAVYDGVAPEAPIPALYVEPPADAVPCQGIRDVDAAAVVDWETDHPALRGIGGGLDAIAVPAARELAMPPWGAAVVLAASRRGAFPFLVAGERDGRRVACLGAAPGLSADDVPLLLLTLGTLAWLEEPDDAPLAVETGAAVPVAGDPPVVVAERTGVQHAGGRLVLANLFDERESDIGRSGGGEWPAAAPRVAAAASGAGRRELGWWLYAAAAGLLVVEWLAWARGA